MCVLCCHGTLKLLNPILHHSPELLHHKGVAKNKNEVAFYILELFMYSCTSIVKSHGKHVL